LGATGAAASNILAPHLRGRERASFVSARMRAATSAAAAGGGGAKGAASTIQ
jgi:hypothetical protein